jgi:hypothetical protein
LEPLKSASEDESISNFAEEASGWNKLSGPRSLVVSAPDAV